MKSIELSFLLAGHKKFSPDRFFRLIKKVFRRSSVSTLSDIEIVMKRSTKAHQNIPQCRRSNGGETLVTFYQWSEHLALSVFSLHCKHTVLSQLSCNMPGTRCRILARVFKLCRNTVRYSQTKCQYGRAPYSAQTLLTYAV